MAPKKTTKQNKKEVLAQTRKVKFNLEDIDIGYINAIRRTIISNISCVAPSFDAYHPELNDFTFIMNKTSLHNEFLGHRIALVPMHFTIDEINNYDSKQFTFEINVHNTTNNTIDVTSKDIIIYDANGKQTDDAFRDRIFPPDPITKQYILITMLKPNAYNQSNGEQLHVKFSARTGVGKDNARWSTVSQCTHFYNVDEVKSELARKDAGVKPETWNTLEKYKYFYTNDHGEPNNVSFIIESINQSHDPFQYWKIAIDILTAEIEELKKTRTQRVTFKKTQHIDEVSIKNVDDTLGNLLHAVAYNEFYKSKTTNQLKYIGFYKTHPLESELIFKIRFDTSQDVHEFFEEWLSRTLEVLQPITNAPNNVEYC